MADYAKILLAVAPHGKPEIIQGFAASMQQCIDFAELSSKLRLAHFIAQCAHESAGFRTTTEYASGSAYEGRPDLGNSAPGDGRRCKGRGVIQNTGAAAYRLLSKVFGIDFYAHPEKLAEFPWAALAAAHYWATHLCRGKKHLNDLADADDIVGVTAGVNGGENGLASRKSYLAKSKHALSDLKGALILGAAEEATAATAKTRAAAASIAPAVAAPAVVLSPAPAAHAALGSGGEWALIVLGLAALGAAVWFFFNIRKHQDAAQALTAAAKEI